MNPRCPNCNSRPRLEAYPRPEDTNDTPVGCPTLPNADGNWTVHRFLRAVLDQDRHVHIQWLCTDTGQIRTWGAWGWHSFRSDTDIRADLERAYGPVVPLSADHDADPRLPDGAVMSYYTHVAERSAA